MTGFLLPMVALAFVASLWGADLSTAGTPAGSPTPLVSAQALVDECRTAFNDNDFKKALDDCNNAIALDSSVASAYALRGDVKDLMGDLHGALQDYDRAIKLNPNYEYGFATRCDTRRELKDYNGAARRPIASVRSSSTQPTGTLSIALADSTWI